MTVQNESAIAAPVAKAVSVWAAVGITSWADAASFLAAIYSLALLAEFAYKKLKPWLVAKGYVKGDTA